MHNLLNGSNPVDMASISDIQSDLVRGKINAGEMFTALDITRESQLKGVFERHDNIKSNVHDLYHNAEMGTYDRTLISIDGVPGQVWCYYDPSLSNPADYRSRWIGVAPGGQPNDVSNAPATDVPVFGYSLDDQTPLPNPPVIQHTIGDYDRDARGRLWVSKPLIASLKVKEGDTVFVLAEAGQIRITSNSDKANAFLDRQQKPRLYRVDRHGNVAISKVNFEQSGINFDSVDAKIDDGDVLIIPAN